MLDQLLTLSSAMPAQHFTVLAQALKDAERRAKSPDIGSALLRVRTALTTARAGEVDPAVLELAEAAVTGVARLLATDWYVLRLLLLDAYEQTAGVVPIAAWLREFVVEVDGRRLEHEVELLRMSAGQ